MEFDVVVVNSILNSAIDEGQDPVFDPQLKCQATKQVRKVVIQNSDSSSQILGILFKTVLKSMK